MRFHPHVLFMILLCWFGITSLAGAANSQQEDSDLGKQRAAFIAAEKALKKKEIKTYMQLRDGLLDYPLLPYLDYQETLATLEQQSIESITNRLKWLEGTPLQKKLRRHWLALLAKERLWASYLKFSREGGTIRQQCNRLQAMM
jgi:soluble lytic murein transglycosylase